MMNKFATLASWLFGLALVALSIFVSVETLARKVFSFSFEGADELGGYVLAVGSSLAFVVALIDRAHIRIDILHARLPPRVQTFLDWLSIISLALLGLFVVYIGRIVILDTISYGSTAPTPWGTPLIYPQLAWYLSLCLFALCAIVLAVKASVMMYAGRHEDISRLFHPKGTLDEVKEELSDLDSRSGS